MVAKSVPVNERYLSQMEWILVIYTALALWLRDLRIEDVLDLGEKFNDVYCESEYRSLVERCTVYNDILVLGERIHDSLVVCEWCFN